MSAAAIADDVRSARSTFPFSFHPTDDTVDDKPIASTSPYPDAPTSFSSPSSSVDTDISHHIHQGHDHVYPEPIEELSQPPAKPCTTTPTTTPVVLSPYLSQFPRQSLLHSPLLSVLTAVEEVDEPTHLLAFDALVNSCQRVVLPAGEFLVKQDEVGDQFFVIAEGEVDIVKSKPTHTSTHTAAHNNHTRTTTHRNWLPRDEKRQHVVADDGEEETTIVAAAGPGAIVGELSVFYDIPRQASLLTRTDVVAYSINRAAFTSFLASHPLLSNALSHRRWLRSVLLSHYLFAHVEDEAEKERLISSFTPLYYGQHDVIIQQGEDADRFYLLEQGRCQVSTLNQTTLESVPVANVHPNQSFGEVALLYATHRSATVRCTSEGGCVVWSVNGREFLQHCQRASLFLQHVFYRFAHQTNEMTHEKLMSKEDFQTAMRFIHKFQKHNTADALSSSSHPHSAHSALSDDRVRLMFRLADVSGDSVISFSEFLHLHILLTHPHSCAELAFRLFDRNSSGEIDRDEFIRVVRWLAEDRGEKLDLSHSKYIKEVFGDRLTLSFAHFSQLLRENSFPSFLSTIRTDLETIDHAMKNLDTSMPLSVALLADNTSLITLPSQLLSIDQIDDHLFRLPWRTLIAGGVAGGLSRTLVSPLERLKILFQTQGGEMEAKYTSVRQGLRLMWREDGLRGLFRGNGSNVIRIVPAVALQFFFYDIFRRFMFDHPFVPITETDNQKRQKHELGTPQRLVAGAGAGIAACMLTYPLDFIRARLTLQQGPNALYGGILDGFRQVYRNEGILGFYRGLWPSVVGIAPYLGLDFAVYEGLKKCVPVDGEEGKPAKTALFACGAVAGTVGQCVSYPIDTVRRRMQVQGFIDTVRRMQVQGVNSEGFGPAAAAYHYGGSISETMKTIVKEEGVRGLYKGMTANLAKVAPAVSISFVTYEYMRELLGLEGL